MIPLYDDIPSRRFPIVTIVLILASTVIFFYELQLGPSIRDLFQNAGVVPQYFTNTGQDLLAPKKWSTLITYMFLHGGWLHILGNMWMLWIFGDNVEDRLGRLRFLIFYLATGIASALVHIYFNPSSTTPTVGASGAIAGVMGAYLLLYPKARVVTVVPVFIFLHIIKLPAFIFLGIWFAMQFLMGTASQAMQGSGGGIAWWAHIGGFVAGAFLITTLMRPKRMANRRVA